MNSSEQSSLEGGANYAGNHVRRFLEHSLGIYCNTHGVVLTLHCDDAITVASTFYRTVAGGMHTVGVTYESENMNRFLETFAIKEVIDLEGISVVSLMALYQQGWAELYCSLENRDEMLCFRKYHDCMYAKDDFDVEHAVPGMLESADAIIGYTKWYLEGTV